MNDLEDFTQRLDKADPKRAAAAKKEQIKKEAESKNLGLQAGVEFTGSIIIGIAIGLGLDYALGTKPIFFLGFFFLGIFTGFFNVYRVTQNMGNSIGFIHMHKELHPEKKDAKTSPELKSTDSNTDTNKD